MKHYKRTATEEYAERLRTFDKVIETYINTRQNLKAAPLACYQYNDNRRPVNRFLLAEYTADVETAMKDARLDAEERSTLVRLLLEQMTETTRVPERYHQPVINKVGRVFVKRHLDPAHWFKWVRRKLDWRKALVGER